MSTVVILALGFFLGWAVVAAKVNAKARDVAEGEAADLAWKLDQSIASEQAAWATATEAHDAVIARQNEYRDLMAAYLRMDEFFEETLTKFEGLQRLHAAVEAPETFEEVSA